MVHGIDGRIGCNNLDCPRRSAVDELLQDHQIEHIVNFDEDTFNILHPLRERIDGQLLDCQLHNWLANRYATPVPPGRYQALEREGGWAFIPLE